MAKNRYDIIADRITEEKISPTDMLKRDRTIVLGLRGKNNELKTQVKELLVNNGKLVELIEILDERIKRLNDDMMRRFHYSFIEGGWIETGSVARRNLELEDESGVSVNDINNQLEEILKLINRYKKA